MATVASTGVSGVRSSWLRTARKWSLARLAASADLPGPLGAEPGGSQFVLGLLAGGDVLDGATQAHDPVLGIPQHFTAGGDPDRRAVAYRTHVQFVAGARLQSPLNGGIDSLPVFHRVAAPAVVL